MRTSALSARLSEVLLWLVWPVLALALACISGTALTGPKPVSGQFLPSWSHAEAPVAQNSLLHREIWPSTIPPPSAPTLSGLYAGNGGLNVNVAGNTTLTAGTLSSTAPADLNSFTTGTLTVNSEQNHSDATATSEGFSFSGGPNLGSVASGGAGGVAAIGQSLLGNGLQAGTGGLSGGGVDQTSRSTSSSVITAGVTPVITSGQAVQGTYDTSSAGANPTLTNSFDAQTLTNDLAIQQIAGQLTAEGLGDVADALANSSNPTLAKAFSEGGLGRILLETAGNAGVAALGGGNVAAAAGGTLAGGLATNLAAAADLFPNDPVLAALATNILESGAGAVGGLIGGATTGGNTGIDALTGAGAASLINLYNQDADLNKKMKALDADALGPLDGTADADTGASSTPAESTTVSDEIAQDLFLSVAGATEAQGSGSPTNTTISADASNAGGPIIGDILANYPSDTMIHLTPNSADDFASGVYAGTYFARLGDVVNMTISQYQANVVGGAAAAGPGQPVNGFITASPGNSNAFTNAGIFNNAGIMEYINSELINASGYVPIK